MSANDDGGAGRREVAYRLFAAEFDDADFSYSESDEERAPNYVVTPTGARVNRLFLVGVLTEVETVSEDYLRARVVDPSGPFVIYAGQYQPDALAFLESADPPTFVAVTGKARTYQPDDSDEVYTSVRPESISEVDADTRDRWVVQTAEQTVDRVARAAEAKHSDLTGDDLRAALEAHGIEESLAAGIPIALERYGTTASYLEAVRDLATDAARVVAGERDEVESLTVLPDRGDDAGLTDLVERPIEHEASDAAAEASDEDISEAPTEPDDEAGQHVGTAAASTDRTEASDASEPSTASAADSGSSSTETTTETTADGDESSPTEAAESTTPTDDAAAGADSETDESTGASEAETAPAASTDPVEQEETTLTDQTGPGGSEPAVDETTSTADAPSGDDTTPTGTDDDAEDLGDFDPEFDLDEDEREEIESEYGTEFQSGTEVEEPGSADIETPDPEELAEEDTAADPAAVESEAADPEPTTTATESTADAEAEEQPDEAVTQSEPADDGDEPPTLDGDVDLEDAAMDAMAELDDGDGADHDAVVDAVVDRTGADAEAVEEAIQDALMGGRCYEPDDGILKPI